MWAFSRIVLQKLYIAIPHFSHPKTLPPSAVNEWSRDLFGLWQRGGKKEKKYISRVHHSAPGNTLTKKNNEQYIKVHSRLPCADVKRVPTLTLWDGMQQ
jgi:hypothetical protein